MTDALRILFLATALIAPTIARSEGGCPPGQFPQNGPGWHGCTPPPASAPRRMPSAEKEPTWISKWQAAAADLDNAIAGFSRGSATERDAVSSALSNCEDKGGIRCKILTTMKNGCIALAEGKESGISNSTELTRIAAETSALKDCNSHFGNCNIYYSHCDYADVMW